MLRLNLIPVFKEHIANECWNCAVSLPAEVLLREFEQQYQLVQPTLGFVLWETYADLHQKVSTVNLQDYQHVTDRPTVRLEVNFSNVITSIAANSTQLLFTMRQKSAGGKQRKTNWSSKSAKKQLKHLGVISAPC